MRRQCRYSLQNYGIPRVNFILEAIVPGLNSVTHQRLSARAGRRAGGEGRLIGIKADMLLRMVALTNVDVRARSGQSWAGLSSKLQVYKAVKRQFFTYGHIGMKFGGWVAGTKWTRIIPIWGGGARPIGGEVGSDACTTHHPSHDTIPKRLGPLSTILVGKVADPKSFFTRQIQITTAHAHNNLLLYLVLYLVDGAQTWEIGLLTHSKHLSHPIFLVTNGHTRFLNLLHVQFFI